MALGINTESGSSEDWVPYIKYDARAGRWFRKTDEGDEDCTNGFRAVFDFANIQVGWLLFAAGVAPQMDLVKLGEPMPARPSDQHKQGFKCNLVLEGLGVYEMASSAKSVMGSIDSLHDAYTAAPEAAAGQLPVIAFTGTTVIETSHAKGVNRNYAPNLEIVGWVARPASLDANAPVASAPAVASPAAAPPATSAAPVNPPAASAPAPVGNFEFG